MLLDNDHCTASSASSAETVNRKVWIMLFYCCKIFSCEWIIRLDTFIYRIFNVGVSFFSFFVVLLFFVLLIMVMIVVVYVEDNYLRQRGL